MEKEIINYSFLMSVYYKENPEFFRLSIESVLNQTLKTNDFVIVCDGPLTKELEDVISEFEKNDVLNIVRLENNSGLGIALNKGLEYCKNEIVLRADSDDICDLTRAEKQVSLFDEGYDIVGAGIAQFKENPNEIDCYRIPPESHEKIVKFCKKRCPFNHPAIAYRKSAILDCNSYLNLKYFEDYYLWVRCLIKGKKAYNIQEPLVFMRTGNGMYKRRSGKEYTKGYRYLFKYMLKNKFINYFQYLRNIIIYFLYSTIPPKLRENMSKKMYRKKKL